MSSLAHPAVTRFRDLADVDWASFLDFAVPRWDATAGRFAGYVFPPNLLTNPMTTRGDLIYNNGLADRARLPVGAAGLVLSVVGSVPAWEPPVPGYAAVPYGPPSSGADTMPESAAYVAVPDLTGDLTLTLRDAFHLPLSQVILVKAGLLNGHTLTLAGQGGNTVEDAATLALTADGAAVQLVGSPSAGTWRIVGGYRLP